MRRSALPLVLVLALLVLPLGGCLDDSVGAHRALDLELTVENGTVQVGDSVVVRVEGEGQSLGELTVSWGDGAFDMVELMNAVEFGRRKAHLYEAAGSYQIEASLTTFGGETVIESASIDVVEGGS